MRTRKLKQKYKTMYMHTLNSQPASYHEGSRRLYCGQYIGLVTSLRTLQRQQRDAKRALPPGFSHNVFGYRLVRVPV